MKIEKKFEEFFLYWNSGRLLLGVSWHFNRKLWCRPFRQSYGLALRILLGRGAGCIGGRTAYLAINPGSYLWALQHRGGVLSNDRRPNVLSRWTRVFCGITRNANIVPYMAR